MPFDVFRLFSLVKMIFIVPKSLGYVISYCGGLLVDYASIYISTFYLYIVHLIFIYGLLGQCILYPENCMTKNNFERAVHIHYVCLSASQSIQRKSSL